MLCDLQIAVNALYGNVEEHHKGLRQSYLGLKVNLPRNVCLTTSAPFFTFWKIDVICDDSLVILEDEIYMDSTDRN